MKHILILISIFSISVVSTSQSTYRMKENDKEVDVNFLSSYYHQDGNNSAVEGGIGSEKLDDVASIIIINIPLDSTRSVNATIGADFYTSASTDMIDADRSSASSKDLRAYFNFGYTQKDLDKGTTYGIRLGLSNEYDYFSINGGLSFTKEWNEGNSELSLQAQAFIDSWRLYFPDELKEKVSVAGKGRNSYNFSAVYSKVINQRMQMSISGEAIYMTGLLSTPFHRVFFNDQSSADIERLPDSRLKFPISVRLNYFAHERFVIRTFYRYYTDDFGIDAHTGSIEVPIKLSDSYTISPYYRYHTQTGSQYFAAFGAHSSSETFYTSDYDLSELSSQQYGLGFSYSPTFGISQSHLLGRDLTFKAIELRLGYYTRDTGLNGYIGSINFQFKL